MPLIAGALLVLLGVALWLAAGLVPVLRMVASSNGTTPHGTADLTLYLTWMGVIRLKQRHIGRIKGARTVRLPDRAAEEVQLHMEAEGGWQTFTLPKMKQQLSATQLSRIIDRYAEAGGPPALSLPLKDRLTTLITFGLLFPLGTVSFLAGALLVINGF